VDLQVPSANEGPNTDRPTVCTGDQNIDFDMVNAKHCENEFSSTKRTLDHIRRSFTDNELKKDLDVSVSV